MFRIKNVITELCCKRNIKILNHKLYNKKNIFYLILLITIYFSMFGMAKIIYLNENVAQFIYGS